MDKKTLLDPELAEYMTLLNELGYVSQSEDPENPVIMNED